MSIRSVILGLLLGLFISGATYFNDAVIRQTMLIGNHLPVGIFGLVLLALIALNPLLGVARDKWGLWTKGPLRPVEILIITAIGLAACGWPGSNFYRGATAVTALPQHWYKTQAPWKAAHVMSYVPGVSAKLGGGHVQDWPRVVDALRAADTPEGNPIDQAIWERMPDRVRQKIETTSAKEMSVADRDEVLTAINDQVIAPLDAQGPPLYELARQQGVLPPKAEALLEERQALLDKATRLTAEADSLQAELREVAPVEEAAADPEAPDAAPEALAPGASAHARDLATQIDLLKAEASIAEADAAKKAEFANRLTLVAHWPEAILPPPAGEGVLVAGGRADEFIVDTLLTGRGNSPLSLWELPWAHWWPTIRLWGGTALFLGLASLCLAMIVHPQWSRRELLAYPIVRFLEEASEQEPGAWLPRVMKSKLFWLGVALPVFIHTVNGLHAWNSWVPEIPMTLEFGPLRELFPTARRVGPSKSYFGPIIFMSVIAFAFFLQTNVSFSLGISQLLMTILGVILIANGQSLNTGFTEAGNGNMLRFGSYLAITLIILYTGRRYYLNVVASAVGAPRAADTPAYAPWACRGLVFCVVAMIALLSSGGFEWWIAALLVLLILIMVMVMARITAETGLFFNQAWWLPAAMFVAVFGLEAIGPTTYILLGIASMLLVGDPRESVMPFLINALRMTDRPRDGATVGKASPWLGIMVAVGLAAAGGVTLYNQYNDGIAVQDGWATKSMPSMTFDNLATYTKQMASDGVLASATAASGAEKLSLIRPQPGALGWIGLGMALVLVTSILRLRLPWWPLHPVAFLVWGTYPIGKFAFCFLLGSIIKASVTHVAGAKGYHDAKPLMVGVIGGELFMIFFWIIVGAVYYWATGLQPERYLILPG